MEARSARLLEGTARTMRRHLQRAQNAHAMRPTVTRPLSTTPTTRRMTRVERCNTWKQLVFVFVETDKEGDDDLAVLIAN